MSNFKCQAKNKSFKVLSFIYSLVYAVRNGKKSHGKPLNYFLRDCILHKNGAQLLCNYCGYQLNSLFIADFCIFTKLSYILSRALVKRPYNNYELRINETLDKKKKICYY